jgi:hypothetical protein
VEYLIGIALALTVSLSATFTGFDRDRSFYPTIMVVIASYYGLFAVISGSIETLLVESIFIVVFVSVTAFGYSRNLWFVVGALLAHGVFDLFHSHIAPNTGVPVWWPMFCFAYDVVAAAYLAWLLKSSRLVPIAH